MARIALITSTTRSPRVNPYITAYVRTILDPLVAALNAAPNSSVTLEAIDIASQSLPLFDEPLPPVAQPAADPTPHYAHAHTRAWSTVIRPFDAYIFVTPQYNSSIPASLKNAIDFLFWEWKDKPAGIITYGGGGGENARVHLRDILLSLALTPVPAAPALHLSRTTLEHAVATGEVGPDDVERWSNNNVPALIETLFKELVEALNAKPAASV